MASDCTSKNEELRLSRGQTLKLVSKLFVCTAGGIVFGIAAEKGQVHVPLVIISQMQFTQFTMLKMFLSTIATSTIVFSFISVYAKNVFERISSNFVSGFESQTLSKTITGGIILGIGMTLCGSCPGMVLVQIGAVVENGVFILSGCFTGALLYGMLDPYLPRSTSGTHGYYNHQLMKIPHHYAGLPFAFALISALLITEYFVPSTVGTPISDTLSLIIAWKTWNPILSGILIGLVQIPIVFAVGDTLGGSTAYCNLLSKGLDATGLLSDKSFQYFKKFNKGGWETWWQVFYVLGAVAGGYFSAAMSNSIGSAAVGITPLSAFLGGVCLLVGARMASGCTSGHGISGMGLFVGHSVLATSFIFVGGAATALLLP